MNEILDDVQFNAECLNLYEGGKVARPEWEGVRQVRVRLYYEDGDWLKQFNHDPPAATWFTQIASNMVPHIAACINERGLRDELRKRHCGAIATNIHGTHISYGRDIHDNVENTDERVALLAAVKAMLKEKP